MLVLKLKLATSNNHATLGQLFLIILIWCESNKNSASIKQNLSDIFTQAQVGPHTQGQ